MKHLSILLLLVFIRSFSNAQQVRLSGILKDSNSEFLSNPRAILNDTLNRFSKKYLAKPSYGEENIFMENYDIWSKLIKDSSLVVKPNAQHQFSINADLKDSISFTSNHHTSQCYAVKDLLKKDSILITLIKIPCIPYVECIETNPKLYVFIGEKIKVDYASRDRFCNRILMDSEFDASYKVIKNLYGDYKGDSINFTAYDHYGTPSFSHHQYVLLFVSEYCGKLIHQKYQFFDVYPTKDGRWASPGDPWRFNRPDSVGIRGEKIDFGDLRFDKVIDVRYHKMKFEEPYFKIRGNCVEPLMGAYLDELFDIKKKTVLKARGITFQD